MQARKQSGDSAGMAGAGLSAFLETLQPLSECISTYCFSSRCTCLSTNCFPPEGQRTKAKKTLLNWKITSSKLICRKSNTLSFIIPKPMKATQGTAPCALYREKEEFCLKKTQIASLRDWGKKCSSLMMSLVSVSFI